MNEIERNAWLLCRARHLWRLQRAGQEQTEEQIQAYVDVSWQDVVHSNMSWSLAATGLTFAPIEPDDETVERWEAAAYDAWESIRSLDHRASWLDHRVRAHDVDPRGVPCRRGAQTRGGVMALTNSVGQSSL